MLDSNQGMTVTVEIDNTQAKASLGEISNALSSGLPKSATDGAARSAAAVDGLTSSIQKSATQMSTTMERMLQNLERRAELAGKSGMDRLRIQQEQTLRSVSSD